MAMTSWHSYPSLYNVGHAALKDLLLDEVIVEEKVDGSQFSFGVFDGELKVRSKGVQMCVDAPEKMFSLGVEYVKSIKDLLHDGYTYRGEYLRRPSHNTLKYDRIPNNHIIIFDINTAEETYMSYEDKVIEAARIGLETVPLLFKGMVTDLETARGFLDRTSVLGSVKIEGFVIKNYLKFGRDKKALFGKFVSEAFKEVHGGTWREANPTKGDILEFMAAKYKTPARWLKSIQHLKEEGQLQMSPKDIGVLIKYIQTDITKECSDEIKEELLQWALPHILRKSIGGAPEFYKEWLLKAQFENE